jgi:hypothetical protein
MAPSPARLLLRWAVAWAVLASVLVVALRWVVVNDVVTCSKELRSAPEPAGWRAWPELPELGGYRVEGESGPCVGHGQLCGVMGAELRDDRVCPGAGVWLDTWFGGRGIYASPRDVHLHASGGTFVVSALGVDYGGPPDSKEQVFLGAFQPVKEARHPAFSTQHGMLSAILLAVALAGGLAAGLDAWRRAARATAYLDRARFRPGTRDASGALVLSDGSLPPILPGTDEHPADGRPGPVLVRVMEVRGGSYRQAPSAHVAEVVDGDAPTLARTAVARARTNLRRAFTGGVALLLTMLLVQAYVVVRDFHLE